MTLDRRSFLAWLAMSAPMSAVVRGQSQSNTPGYDWQNISRVVAIGDIHGERDALVAVLRMGQATPALQDAILEFLREH